MMSKMNVFVVFSAILLFFFLAEVHGEVTSGLPPPRKAQKPELSPEEIWYKSVTKANVTFELSSQKFVPGTIVWANCNVDMNRFNSKDNDYSVVFKAGQNSLGYYQVFADHLKTAKFRSNEAKLRETKHQILEQEPRSSPSGQLSILLKPYSPDEFSCELEIQRSKAGESKTLYVYASNIVKMSE